MISHTIKRN